eukprot:COSAG01_NODE_2735_length_7165_cov_327.658081_6_plen_98_part_00
MKVPANTAVSTALPFNASVEVLSDGMLASHKAHYAVNYSAKMGVTDSTIRLLVLGALRKQKAKPEATVQRLRSAPDGGVARGGRLTILGDGERVASE